MNKDTGSITRKLSKNGLLEGLNPYAVETHYEVIMGSFAYGVSDTTSDMDVYGVFTPPLEHVFPHTAGYIHGFGDQPPTMDIYQKHHITLNEKEYDVALYSIVKYFQLCMDNNPNMIDSLFVPPRCIVHQSDVGKIIREHRKMFLHKGIHHRMKGYAYQQMKAIDVKNPLGKRKESVEEFGYDVKYAYHIVRLLMEAEMVMTEGDLDLERSRELLKAVRRGEWTLDELKTWFKKKESELDTLYVNSSLPYKPDHDKIKRVLFTCLEAHYGNLSAYFNMEGSSRVAQNKLNRIREILDE